MGCGCEAKKMLLEVGKRRELCVQGVLGGRYLKGRVGGVEGQEHARRGAGLRKGKGKILVSFCSFQSVPRAQDPCLYLYLHTFPVPDCLLPVLLS